MSLTDDQVEHFFREGYIIVPGLLSKRTIKEVMPFATPRAQTGDFWQATVFDHNKPEVDAPIHRILCEPSIVRVASQLLHSPARVWYGMLAIVPGGGKGLPWHQDNQYTMLVGGALNCFIALGKITPDMATLWVSPRSHLGGVQPARTSDEHHGHRIAQVEPTNGVPMPVLEPGDACVFDRCTYHRSVKNETDQPRFAYAAQYQADFCRIASTGKLDPIRMRAIDLRKQIAGALKAQPAAAGA